jgi:hypothetical protein
MKGTWLDEYDRKARMLPGLLALAPIVVVGVALGLRSSPIVTLLLGSLSSIGGPVVLAAFVRQHGQALQDQLWPRWGGPPTTTHLWLGNATTDAVRAGRRRHVEQATGVTLPTAEDEAADQAAARGRYEDAVRQLITLMRNKKRFPLTFKENVNYGYWRNLLALRPLALPLSALCLGVLVAVAVTGLIRGFPPSIGLEEMMIGAIADLALVCFWTWYPNELSTHRAANTFAERILDEALTVKGSAQAT